MSVKARGPRRPAKSDDDLDDCDVTDLSLHFGSLSSRRTREHKAREIMQQENVKNMASPTSGDMKTDGCHRPGDMKNITSPTCRNRRNTASPTPGDKKCTGYPTSGDMKNTASPTLGVMKNTASPTSGDIKNTVSPTSGDMKNTAYPTSGGIKNTVSPTSGDMKNTAYPTSGGMKNTVSPTSGDMKNTAYPTSEDMKNTAYPTSGGMKNTVSPTSGDIKNTVSPTSGGMKNMASTISEDVKNERSLYMPTDSKLTAKQQGDEKGLACGTSGDHDVEFKDTPKPKMKLTGLTSAVSRTDLTSCLAQVMSAPVKISPSYKPGDKYVIFDVISDKTDVDWQDVVQKLKAPGVSSVIGASHLHPVTDCVSVTWLADSVTTEYLELYLTNPASASVKETGNVSVLHFNAAEKKAVVQFKGASATDLACLCTNNHSLNKKPVTINPWFGSAQDICPDATESITDLCGGLSEEMGTSKVHPRKPYCDTQYLPRDSDPLSCTGGRSNGSRWGTESFSGTSENQSPRSIEPCRQGNQPSKSTDSAEAALTHILQRKIIQETLSVAAEFYQDGGKQLCDIKEQKFREDVHEAVQKLVSKFTELLLPDCFHKVTGAELYEDKGTARDRVDISQKHQNEHSETHYRQWYTQPLSSTGGWSNESRCVTESSAGTPENQSPRSTAQDRLRPSQSPISENQFLKQDSRMPRANQSHREMTDPKMMASYDVDWQDVVQKLKAPGVSSVIGAAELLPVTDCVSVTWFADSVTWDYLELYLTNPVRTSMPDTCNVSVLYFNVTEKKAVVQFKGASVTDLACLCNKSHIVKNKPMTISPWFGSDRDISPDAKESVIDLSCALSGQMGASKEHPRKWSQFETSYRQQDSQPLSSTGDRLNASKLVTESSAGTSENQSLRSIQPHRLWNQPSKSTDSADVETAFTHILQRKVIQETVHLARYPGPQSEDEVKLICDSLNVATEFNHDGGKQLCDIKVQGFREDVQTAVQKLLSKFTEILLPDYFDKLTDAELYGFEGIAHQKGHSEPHYRHQDTQPLSCTWGQSNASRWMTESSAGMPENQSPRSIQPCRTGNQMSKSTAQDHLKPNQSPISKNQFLKQDSRMPRANQSHKAMTDSEMMASYDVGWQDVVEKLKAPGIRSVIGASHLQPVTDCVSVTWLADSVTSEYLELYLTNPARTSMPDTCNVSVLYFNVTEKKAVVQFKGTSVTDLARLCNNSHILNEKPMTINPWFGSVADFSQESEPELHVNLIEWKRTISRNELPCYRLIQKLWGSFVRNIVINTDEKYVLIHGTDNQVMALKENLQSQMCKISALRQCEALSPAMVTVLKQAGGEELLENLLAEEGIIATTYINFEPPSVEFFVSTDSAEAETALTHILQRKVIQETVHLARYPGPESEDEVKLICDSLNVAAEFNHDGGKQPCDIKVQGFREDVQTAMQKLLSRFTEILLPDYFDKVTSEELCDAEGTARDRIDILQKHQNEHSEPHYLHRENQSTWGQSNASRWVTESSAGMPENHSPRSIQPCRTGNQPRNRKSTGQDHLRPNQLPKAENPLLQQDSQMPRANQSHREMTDPEMGAIQPLRSNHSQGHRDLDNQSAQSESQRFGHGWESRPNSSVGRGSRQTPPAHRFEGLNKSSP